MKQKLFPTATVLAYSLILLALLPKPFFAGEIRNPKTTPMENANADNVTISLLFILVLLLITVTNHFVLLFSKPLI